MEFSIWNGGYVYLDEVRQKMKKLLVSKPAIFIYGLVTGWVLYMVVLIFAMKAFT